MRHFLLLSKSLAWLCCFMWIFCCLTSHLSAQTIKADLLSPELRFLHNREASANNGSVQLDRRPGDGLMILKDIRFVDGILNVSIRGEDKPGESFVGIAFNIKDEKTYEAVYFRPFNFKNNERAAHSVQYISMPDHPWETLRTRFPGKYEHNVNPAPDPDGWFNAKIVIRGKSIKVFVNEAAKPCLEVESLTEPLETAIALWVGNNSKGAFKDLIITKGKGR
jgi:hypothetical protein